MTTSIKRHPQPNLDAWVAQPETGIQPLSVEEQQRFCEWAKEQSVAQLTLELTQSHFPGVSEILRAELHQRNLQRFDLKGLGIPELERLAEQYRRNRSVEQLAQDQKYKTIEERIAHLYAIIGDGVIR